MKIKTQDLIGPALDWVVAKCEGLTEFDCLFTAWVPVPGEEHFAKKFSPSTDWSQGGPIIEREGICLGGKNAALNYDALYHGFPENEVFSGPTTLIAAMRCRVASKLGDEVDLPEELLK